MEHTPWSIDRACESGGRGRLCLCRVAPRRKAQLREQAAALHQRRSKKLGHTRSWTSALELVQCVGRGSPRFADTSQPPKPAFTGVAARDAAGAGSRSIEHGRRVVGMAATGVRTVYMSKTLAAVITPTILAAPIDRLTDRPAPINKQDAYYMMPSPHHPS